MTIRIPRWALALLGALALVGIGVVLGLTLAGDGSESATGEASQLDCDRRAARVAIHDSSLAEELPSSPLEDIFDFFTPELVGCRDLNGDDEEEMVVRLLGQTGAAPTPWAVFEQKSGGWRSVLSRQLVQAELKFAGETIQESTRAYADGDATCCPSGKREGVVSWNGRSFTYRPLSGTGNRQVEVAGAEAPAIAGLSTRSGSEPEAVQIFGVPSSVSSLDNSCRARWVDIGLEMIFADLGSDNPCGHGGSFVVAIFSGPEAEQAGWEIGGLQVGDSVDEMLTAYPGASVGNRRYYGFLHGDQPGTPFILASKRSPIGYGNRAPVLAAIALDGKILALDVHSGVIYD